MSYSYMPEMLASSDKYLSMMFTNCVITLEGENLLPILDLLEDDKLQWVRKYDPKKFAPPAVGETVICNISRETLAAFMSVGTEKA